MGELILNKTALKNFATSARRELLQRVELQARKVGITSESIQKAQFESSDAIFIDGKQLSEEERVQRNKLITRISDIGFDRVMEETAYTWFNRFTALRFMEVNDYLPTKVRVLSSINPESAEPDMLKEALSLDLDLDKEHIYEMRMTNNNEELFKYLIIKHCNDLNRYMPFMFETIDDYSEILFPEGLLATDSCIRRMTNIDVIPESNWEKIEVIGWLYQYYIAEEKDRVFKAKKKYKAEEIPFATQLFTPDWIVQYMVQNSLGRYWVEANPTHQDLISGWEFYLQNTEEGFEEKIAPYINKELKVEEVKCFDPAMGSGHILVYMFDVLYEIYSKSGYMEREIPRLIIENNLFGLDIDDRAYQLASFSVVMKAVQYNKRFLRSIEKEGLTLNLASIQETNTLTEEDVQYLANGSNGNLDETRAFIEQFQDAKTIGSLIKIAKSDTRYLQQRLEAIQTTPVKDLFEVEQREKALSLLPKLIKQAQIMSLEFDVLVTNPPYMGSGSMNKELGDYLKKNYPDSKADLFAAFMEVDHYVKKNGFYASINQHSWMFLSSFEKMRKKIIQKKFIDSLLHLGPRAFEDIGGEVVQSTTFVLRNTNSLSGSGTYLRLIEGRTAKEKLEKVKAAIRDSSLLYHFSFNQEQFNRIPGSPIAYWATNPAVDAFVSTIGRQFKANAGISTGNNENYIFFWHEVPFNNIALYKEQNKFDKVFSPLAKGGEFRKWYGNQNHVIKYNKSSLEEMKKLAGFRHDGNKYYFNHLLSWSKISSTKLSVRYYEPNHIFDSAAPTISTEKVEYELLGFLNSKLAEYFLSFISPTLNYPPGYIELLPYRINRNGSIVERVKESLEISKEDWNSFENSWEFQKHPFVSFSTSKIESAYREWKNEAELRFNQLKLNEEELNRIFIKDFGLETELNSKMSDEEITVRRAEMVREVKSFLSYALGCVFGRYSLDKNGLIYAGGDGFNASNYEIFSADEDNIVPILHGTYFKDDIIMKIVEFVGLTYSEDNVEENLGFLSDAIGRRDNETSREALRRYFLNDFYKDHLQVYKKKPIYWLFTSGKEKAFNCLIYIHRYDKTTLSRIRTDYLHQVQIRMDAEKKDLLNIIEGDSTTKEISNAKKELKSLDKKIDELKIYDEKLHHMADMQIEIDLDDGVAVNYAKFEGLVAEI